MTKPKTLREKIKEISTYHSDDGTSGYLLSDEQIDEIIQAMKEAMPKAKNIDVDKMTHDEANDDSYRGYLVGYNFYRTELLKRLEEI